MSGLKSVTPERRLLILQAKKLGFRSLKSTLSLASSLTLLPSKKKSKVRRNRRGGGTDLPVFSALNGMSKKEILNDIEAVGIVQTAINPNDKTKPEGFRTNATRIGGTVSMINTGNRDIPANVPVMWDAPFKNTPDQEYRDKVITSECGEIKGHPEGIVYPAVRAYQEDDVAARLLEVFMHHLETDPTSKDPDEVLRWLDEERKKENTRTKTYTEGGSTSLIGINGSADFQNADVQKCFGTGKGGGQEILKKKIAGVLIERQRIIGWSLNHAHPGDQLDIILKKG